MYQPPNVNHTTVNTNNFRLPFSHYNVFRDYQSIKKTQEVSPPTSPRELDLTRMKTKMRRGRRSRVKSGLMLSLNLLSIILNCFLMSLTALSARFVWYSHTYNIALSVSISLSHGGTQLMYVLELNEIENFNYFLTTISK